MDVFKQRLENEYAADLIITNPNVSYRGIGLKVIIVVHKEPCKSMIIRTPSDFPESKDLKEVLFEEPQIQAKIIFPQSFLGKILDLCHVLVNLILP